MSITDIRELKTRSRELLYRKHAFFAALTFFIAVTDVMLSSIAEYAFPATGGTMNTVLFWAAAALTNIVSYLLMAGVLSIYLNLCRQQQSASSDLLFAFKVHPEPIAVFSIIQFAIQFAVIHGGSNAYTTIRTAKNQTALLLDLAIMLVAIILLVWLELSVSMVLFLYCDDPQKGIRELLEESWELTRTCRGKLLYMYLSFTGVYLLGVLSFGIGLLFAKPYLLTTRAQFYLKLKSHE